jgi:hypothetical protein
MRRGRFRDRRLFAALASMLAAVGVVAAMLVANPAQAATTGALRGAGSNRCLDVIGASQNDGAYVQIYDCSGGSNQQWTLTSSNQLTVYGNKCLDVPGHATAAGTRTPPRPAPGCRSGAAAAVRTSSGG